MDDRMKRGGLSWALALQLALAPGYAQSPPSETLSIVIVEGEGAINNIRLRTARDLVVQVDDENKQPVAGAAVTFTLPSQGASGSFANDQKTATVMTDQQGRAVARRFQPNTAAGKMEIRVNASWKGQTGRATITQFNMLIQAPVATKKSGTKKVVAILVIAGAAAAGGAVYATRKGGPSAAPTTPSVPVITITPGAGTLGPPQ
jgi:hypothetical protein